MSSARKGLPRKMAVMAGLAVVLGWLIYAVVFFSRINGGDSATFTPEIQRLARHEHREEWLAVYQHGRRAGYSHTLLRPQTDGYELIEELLLSLDFLGEVQEVFSRIEARVEQDYSLRSFVFRLRAGAISFRLKGKVSGESLVLTTSMAGQERSQELPLEEPLYLGSGIKFFLGRQDLQVGDTYTLTLLDPATLSRTRILLEVEARETIQVDSRQYEAFRVVLDFHGARLKSWISPEGEVLKEEGFLGLTLVKTDAKDALRGKARTPAELVRQAAVVPQGEIIRPRELNRLRLKLTGISGDAWDLAGGRQLWQQGELTISRESLDQLPPRNIPFGDANMARYLQPTFAIQSDAPQLRQQAAEIAGGQTDALQVTRRLSTWVCRNLQKRPTLSVPNALEVWRQRAGDCNEHSVLFAALARALGIPTRVAAGLLYADGRFFYHAWNEVFLGEWVAVDSLMNQVPADPTHIRLVAGELDRQVRLLGAIGRVKIQVLDYE